MNPGLARLAEAHGVATSYEDADQRPVVPPEDTIRAALAAMDVPAGTAAEVRSSLAALDQRDLSPPPRANGHCLPPPERAWGWMVQLYGLRSSSSWGIGEFADLGHLAATTATRHGADFVLCNPLHAVAPVVPQEPSPYYPGSRRFFNPLYLRIDDLPELTGLDPDARQRVGRIAELARDRNGADRIDRDAIFDAKMAALAELASAPRSADRQAQLEDFRRREGDGLVGFARFCALAERYPTPFQRWPAALRHPDNPQVARMADPRRVAFHTWLQWLCDTQLAAAQDAARSAGMRIGLVHDLAIGVDPSGPDAWRLSDDLAPGMTVGAPPDPFNRRGQDWRLPPLRPDRLARTGYAPFRDMLRTVLRHAGGIRVDHVLGLFRLYWIPEGAPADAGTYVRYPSEGLLDVLVTESRRAQAIVVGEDLGTVERGVRARLGELGILGSRVLYFERDEDTGRRLRPHEYPPDVLVSVNTHDLPTAPGWWQDAEVYAQHEAGLLPDDVSLEDALERKASERADMRALLEEAGLADDDLSLAMYRLLARTPCRLVGASLADAVGDVRQPNLPGSTDEYPNWRLPLASPDGRPMLLDDVLAHEGLTSLGAILSRRPPG